MPALRGLFASLGAGVSLAAAGSLALLAISAVILFEGFPGLGGGPEGGALSIGELTVPRSEEPAEREDDGPVRLAQAPEEPAPAPAAGPLGDGGAPLIDRGPAPRVDRPDGDLPDTGTDLTDPPNPPEPPGPGPAPQAEPGDGLTGVTGDAVRGTTRTVSGVIDRLVPGSDSLLEGLTDALGNTVESTGGALASTVEVVLSGR